MKINNQESITLGLDNTKNTTPTLGLWIWQMTFTCVYLKDGGSTLKESLRGYSVFIMIKNGIRARIRGLSKATFLDQ